MNFPVMQNRRYLFNNLVIPPRTSPQHTRDNCFGNCDIVWAIYVKPPLQIDFVLFFWVFVLLWYIFAEKTLMQLEIITHNSNRLNCVYNAKGM